MLLNLQKGRFFPGFRKTVGPPALYCYCQVSPYVPRGKCWSEVQGLLEGSWDLVSMVISTLIGLISNYKYSYLNKNPSY